MTSRSSRAGMLPAIRAAPPDPQEDTWNSPRSDSRALVRIDHIEDRLINQEKTTANLVDKAYKIKEDIIDNLNITHGSWYEEKKARELLQDHIRTITDVVRKLSKDIVYLEDQIRLKEGYVEGTSSAVKNLEVHHVAGLTDVRGRVARCDSSLARLSADLKTCFDSIRSLNQQHQEQYTKLMDRLHAMDGKFNTVMARLDKLSAEQEIQVRHVESESTQQLSALDNKTRYLIDDTRSTIQSHKAIEDNERERLEARIVGQLEKALSGRDVINDRLDKKMDENIANLNRKIAKLEEELWKEKERTVSSDQSFDQKMMSALDVQGKRHNDDITKLKRECRDGFSTVQESITNMKQVMDGKRKLLEEQLRKEITQIRKMVILI